MTHREKIAIGVILGLIAILYIIRIFVEQILVSADVEAYTLNQQARELRAENLDTKGTILKESSLWKIQEKAEAAGFVPASSLVVIH